MELVFIFTIILFEIVLIHLIQVVKIVRAFGIDALMEDKVFPFFFGGEGVCAVRADKADGGRDQFAGNESLAADFALVLAIAAVIIVDVLVRGATERTEDIFRDRPAITSLDGLKGLAILPEIVFKEELPVLFDEGFNHRELVDLEFLILRGEGIIRSPLFERDISADEADQPAVLLVK